MRSPASPWTRAATPSRRAASHRTPAKACWPRKPTICLCPLRLPRSLPTFALRCFRHPPAPEASAPAPPHTLQSSRSPRARRPQPLLSPSRWTTRLTSLFATSAPPRPPVFKSPSPDSPYRHELRHHPPRAGECSIALTGIGPGSISVSAANATTQTATLPRARHSTAVPSPSPLRQRNSTSASSVPSAEPWREPLPLQISRRRTRPSVPPSISAPGSSCPTASPRPPATAPSPAQPPSCLRPGESATSPSASPHPTSRPTTARFARTGRSARATLCSTPMGKLPHSRSPPAKSTLAHSTPADCACRATSICRTIPQPPSSTPQSRSREHLRSRSAMPAPPCSSRSRSANSSLPISPHARRQRTPSPSRSTRV